METQNNITEMGIDRIKSLSFAELKALSAHMWIELTKLANDLENECPQISTAVDAIRDGRTIDELELPRRYTHFQRGEIYAEVDMVRGTLKVVNDDTKKITLLVKIDSNDMPLIDGDMTD